MNLSERARATQSVIDKYRTKRFDWSGSHCLRLARSQGIALGHKLPPIPVFRSAFSAQKALKKRGFDSVSDLLDSFFPRLPAPAYAIVGDLVTLPGDGMEAIFIADGLGNLIGWHEAGGEELSNVSFAAGEIIGSWRL